MNRTTLDFILETQEELNFPDGFAMTDWSGHQYCLYAPGEVFGQGKVCGWEEAVDFYQKHVSLTPAFDEFIGFYTEPVTHTNHNAVIVYDFQKSTVTVIDPETHDTVYFQDMVDLAKWKDIKDEAAGMDYDVTILMFGLKRRAR